jgi:hypothetical protein
LQTDNNNRLTDVNHCLVESLKKTRQSWCVKKSVTIRAVKKISWRQMKKQEAQSRMAALRRARRSRQAAAREQRRASLVGDGSKWRITNLAEVCRAIARRR